MTKISINPNHTQIPNFHLDFVMPFLTGSEWKILSYIDRRTFGFQKQQDSISLSQFQHGIKKDGKHVDYGVGIKNKTSIIKAVDALVDLGLIEKDAEYITKYKVVTKLDYHEVVQKCNQRGCKNVTKGGAKSLHTKEREIKGNKDIVETSSTPSIFQLETEIEKLHDDKKRHINIIGMFMETKLKINKKDLKEKIRDSEQLSGFIKRHVKSASQLSKYHDDQLIKAEKEVIKKYPDIDWTLETLVKELTK